MIEQELSALRERVVGEFCGVMEFKAFTEWAYLRSSQAAAANVNAGGGAILGYADFGPHLGVPNRRVETKDIPSQIQAARDGYFLSLVHQHQVSLFEHIFFDLLRIVLLHQPIRLPGDRKIEYSVVIASPTKAEILQAIVERELNELKYRNASDWFLYVQKLVTSCIVAADDVGRIAEAKATRDLIVHNGGITNEIYIRKSGAYARFSVGQSINVAGNYTLECWQLFSRVLIYLVDKFREALSAARSNA